LFVPEFRVFFQRLPEFIGNHYLLVAALVVVIVILLRTEIGQLTRRYKMISPAELVRLINRDNALVIDVSPQADFDKGHIAGARHVALNLIDPEHKELAKVRELPVAVVCRSGMTAQGVCARLSKAGFTRVHCLEGGLNAWIAAELPIVKK
jgi:rhodanese-related sulfurtransferase